MADVFQLADQQRFYLSVADRASAQRMQVAYESLLTQARTDYRAFSTRLDAWKKAHPSQDPRGASPPRHWVFQQARYQDLMKQLEQNLSYYAKVSTASTADAQRAAMQKAQADNTELIRASMGGGEEAAGHISLAVLPDKAIEAVVGFASDGTPLATLLEGRSNRTWQEAGHSLVEGVALGKSAQEVALTLDQQLTTLHWQNLRLARTEMMRAYREGQRVNMLQNADVLSGWRWSSAADRRSCPICLGQHGKVFPIKHVEPGAVPPDTAQHAGLSDIFAKPPAEVAEVDVHAEVKLT